MIVFDKSRRSTFDSAIEWVKKLKDEYGIGTQKLLLVGILFDSNAKIQVSPTMFLKKTDNLNINYFEYLPFAQINDSELRRYILTSVCEKNSLNMKSKSMKMKINQSKNLYVEKEKYCNCNIF